MKPINIPIDICVAESVNARLLCNSFPAGANLRRWLQLLPILVHNWHIHFLINTARDCRIADAVRLHASNAVEIRCHGARAAA